MASWRQRDSSDGQSSGRGSCRGGWGAGRGNGGYGRGRDQSRGFHQHEERGPVQTQDIRPIGYLKLKEFCVRETDPHELLSAFNNPRTGLLALVNSSDVSGNEEKFDMVLGLLHKAVLCRSAPTMLTPLIAHVGRGSFFNSVADRFTAMSIRSTSAWIPVQQLVDIAEVTLSLHPSLVKVVCKPLLMAKTMTAQVPKVTVDLRTKLNALLTRIKETMLLQKREQEEEKKEVKEGGNDEDGTPPEDFRELPIFPTEEEIHSKEKPFLRKIKSAYDDLDHYLDVQFRLLREDFLSPLREGIEEYISWSKGEKTENKRNGDIHVYRNVRVVTAVKIDSGVAHSLTFNPERRSNWSKRLNYGSFVCLSHDNFSTILFGSVANSSKDGLKEGWFEVQFEEHSLRAMQTKAAFLREYVMVETSAFFEMYKPVLASLQKITALPFEDIIVRGSTEVCKPEYLSLDDLVLYNLTAVKAKGCTRELPVWVPGGLDSGETGSVAGSTRTVSSPCKKSLIIGSSPTLKEMMEWPTCEDLGLNESQFEAFQAGITRGLAVIQGPPGTGKTYVGLKIVKALLSNKWMWSRELDGKPSTVDNFSLRMSMMTLGCRDEPPPILIVCYTNHALDQFLEGILEFCPEGIVRVGGRSKSDELKLHTLYEVSQREEFKSKDSSFSIWSMYEELKMYRESGKNLTLRALACTKGVLKFSFIKQYMEKGLAEQLSGALKGVPEDDILLLWLGVSRDLVEREEIAGGQKRRVVYREGTGAWWVVGGDVLSVTQHGKGRRGKPNTQPSGQPLDNDDVFGDWRGQFKMMPPSEGAVGGNTDAVLSSPNVVDEEEKEAERREQNRDYGLEKLLEASNYFSYNLIENLEAVIRQKKPSISTTNTEEWKTAGSKKKKARARLILNKIQSRSYMTSEDAASVIDVWELSHEDRWRLYRWWVANYTSNLQIQAGSDFKQYNNACRILAEIKKGRNLRVMRSAKVVGMTTTGAARNWDLLQELKPRIVVVEEAAEVLEAHIITTLTEACQHLILIGDHQQLRPSSAVYELAKKYNLELSLFERLFTSKVPHTTLHIQHRMRPEISVFMRNIYERIDDHPSAREYPHVKGMTRDVFFISHRELEASRTEDVSHSNEYEAKFCLSLSEYLIKQGYTADQVTILTMYSGQLLLFKKLVTNNPAFETVRSCVTSVDNFQGEESDIIILSLVRSNEEGSLGFIAEDNRVCVALSRAKVGMYVIGNFDMICQKSKLWKKIIDQAKDSGHSGKHLPLMCERHSLETMVSSSADFSKVYQGGCSELCSYRRACGHACGQTCHSEDEEHVEKYADCYKLCAEMNPCGHACTKQCYEPCDPCTTEVYYKLICGHSYSKGCDDPERTHCVTQVQRELSCGHTAKMECPVNVSDYECTRVVTKKLPCDHEAQVMCHIRPIDYQCLEEVSKTLLCGHDAQVMCYISPENYQCLEIILKTLPCGHTSHILCHINPTHYQCLQMISETLPCGHTSDLACSTSRNVCRISISRLLSCGHYGDFECHQKDFTKYHCRKPCSAILGCKHTCAGQCSSCHKSRLHVPCTQPCPRILSCGHKCVGPCTDDCPPCQKMCETKCEHSDCKEKCELPCKPCLEKCGWSCPHECCSKKCSEPCDRLPCQAFCQRSFVCLKCHKTQWCLAMCGEPCIEVCMHCPLSATLEGNTVLPDTGYVWLPECGHVCTVTTMDAVMGEALALGGDSRQAACPLCGIAVRNCRRYRGRLCDVVERVKTDKKKAYGSKSERAMHISMIQQYSTSGAKVPWDHAMSKSSLSAVLFRVKYLDITSELKTRMQLRSCSAELIDDTEVLKEFIDKPRRFVSDNEKDNVKQELDRLTQASEVSGVLVGLSSYGASITMPRSGAYRRGISPLSDRGKVEEPSVEEAGEPAVGETEDESVGVGDDTVD